MAVFSDEVVVTNTVTVDGSSTTQPVSGAVSVSNFPAVQPVSGTVNVGNTVPVTGPLTDAQLRASAVPVVVGQASTGTVTLITSTGSNLTLLAANANRKKAVIHCEGATQYIKLAAVASTTSYTYKVTSNNTTIEIEGYTGIIDSTGTSGKAILVTELV